jgi:hypothetical protein
VSHSNDHLTAIRRRERAPSTTSQPEITARDRRIYPRIVPQGAKRALKPLASSNSPAVSSGSTFRRATASSFPTTGCPNDRKLVWTLREPIATLRLRGKTAGRHYAGPNWEHMDGSAVAAEVVATAPGKTPNDILWLKLRATTHRGRGTLSSVTTVLQINTQGGVHGGPCDTQNGASRSGGLRPCDLTAARAAGYCGHKQTWPPAAPHQLLRKLLRSLARLGCFSFLNALASIWRMRSRVTKNCCPTLALRSMTGEQ